MTKKHFIALADFLRIRTLTPNNGGSFTESQIEQLADFCQSQNPQFNRKRWLGYIAGSNGKNGGKCGRIAELKALIKAEEISEANGATAQLDDNGKTSVDTATCGTCGMSWNDALITDRTPTPSARCAYEHIHAEIAELKKLISKPRREYQPKTGQACGCRPGMQRDNCPQCEGTGQRIDFAAIRGAR